MSISLRTADEAVAFLKSELAATKEQLAAWQIVFEAELKPEALGPNMPASSETYSMVVTGKCGPKAFRKVFTSTELAATADTHETMAEVIRHLVDDFILALLSDRVIAELTPKFTKTANLALFLHEQRKGTA